MAICLFLVTDHVTWDNCNLKICNLANFVPKFDNNLELFKVNLLFEKVCLFEIEKFNYSNSSIIWFDLMPKMLNCNWNSVWIME